MIQPEEKQRPAPGEAASDTMTTTTTTDVVCGKTARACDGCARRRARWYCGADDAFLCQGCDSSVHSANLVARRHQRVRLKTASSPPPSPTPSSCGVVLQAVEQEEAPVPAWLNGFRRKARTPRSQGQAKVVTRSTEPQAPTAVPKLVETSMEHNEEEEEDEHAALYRVPVFDPVLSGFCSAPPPLDDANASSACDAKSSVTAEISDCAPTTSASSTGDASDGQLSAFLPTDVELAEFAANMESLLNGAVEDGNDSFCMEKLGLLDLMDQDGGSCFRGAKPVKAEKHLDVYRDHDNHAEQDDVDASRVTLELSFDLGSPVNGDDAAEEKTARVGATEDDAAEQGVAKTARLRLNYEAIIAAWASQGSSPWTDGKRPQVIKDGRWTEYMGLWMHGAVQMQGAGGGAALDDVGREARVTRYREKRRTRLFSKKIRYEVRKLNAEKRPRIKGRFVKRAPGVALGISH